MAATALQHSLAEVVRSRDLLTELVRRDIRIRYKQAAMGLLWAVLMPVLVVFSGVIVRLIVGQLGGAGVDRAVVGGLLVKAIPWGFVVGGLGFATTSLVTNATLITKVYFPREVLPLSALLAQGFDSLVALIATGLALPLLGLSWGAALLWLPLLLVLLFLLVTAAGLALACGNVFFRDVRYLVQVFLTFGIFFTPVFYEPAMLGPRGAVLVMLNPVAPLLEGLRLSLIEGHNLLRPLVHEGIQAWQPWYLAYSIAWALGGLLAATSLFRRAVSRFAEYI